MASSAVNIFERTSYRRRAPFAYSDVAAGSCSRLGHVGNARRALVSPIIVNADPANFNSAAARFAGKKFSGADLFPKMVLECSEPFDLLDAPPPIDEALLFLRFTAEENRLRFIASRDGSEDSITIHQNVKLFASLSADRAHPQPIAQKVQKSVRTIVARFAEERRFIRRVGQRIIVRREKNRHNKPTPLGMGQQEVSELKRE